MMAMRVIMVKMAVIMVVTLNTFHLAGFGGGLNITLGKEMG